MASRLFASNSNTLVSGQNSLNGDLNSGLHGSEGRLLVNRPAADLEDGEITEEEKSAGRSTARSTPTPWRAVSIEQSLHEPKLPLGACDSGDAVETASAPAPPRTPTPDITGPRPCMHPLALSMTELAN